MYLIRIETKESTIDGKGVFALEDVRKGDVVWKFDPNHDKVISRAQFDGADETMKQELKRVAYLSKSTDRWVYPPENDPARYTNHSKQNNLSVLLDESISEEPIFIANRDIATGEELTNDYTEFDNHTRKVEQNWLK